MTKPSISSYERRDYLKHINRNEGLRYWTGTLTMAVLLLGILFLSMSYVMSWPKAEAQGVRDDKYFCTHIFEMPLEMQPQITSYCSDLAARGL